MTKARASSLAVLIVSSLGATAGPAKAQLVEVPTQEQPRSTWVQPGTEPLDGLGTFVYVDAPAPGATQGSLLGYEYTIQFRFENGSDGVLALGSRNGQKVAGFGLIPSHLVDTVPFDWQLGKIYYLMTYRIAPDQWAAWVYDWSAATWTYIAQQTAPAGTGRMLPSSTTGVDYDVAAGLTPAADPRTCAFYPQVHAVLFAPTGWRGADMTQASLSGNAVAEGDCPSVTATIAGWQYYGLGTTASG